LQLCVIEFDDFVL
jgi:hypothetical protein